MSLKQKQEIEQKFVNEFTEAMIFKIEQMKNEKKPKWCKSYPLLPQNIDGRRYSAMNSFSLQIACERNNWILPVFITQKRINQINTMEEGSKPLQVNPEAKELTVYCKEYLPFNKNSHKYLPVKDYKKLSQEDKDEYILLPQTKIYTVYNVHETNLEEARPELFMKLKEKLGVSLGKKDCVCEQLETMEKDQLWICPITHHRYSDAIYSITDRQILMPSKESCKSDSMYYETLLHEMVHSTGEPRLLDRHDIDVHDIKSYAREELIAELGAAVAAQHFGLPKSVKNEAAAYLDSWLGEIRENPAFLRSVVGEVQKATAMIERRATTIEYALQNKKDLHEEVSRQNDLLFERYAKKHSRELSQGM